MNEFTSTVEESGLSGQGTLEDALAREQLRDGAHEISDAAADVASSVGDAAVVSFDDVVDTARELIRERPLVAIAAAAGIAYLFARLTR